MNERVFVLVAGLITIASAAILAESIKPSSPPPVIMRFQFPNPLGDSEFHQSLGSPALQPARRMQGFQLKLGEHGGRLAVVSREPDYWYDDAKDARLGIIESPGRRENAIMTHPKFRKIDGPSIPNG